MQIECPTCKTTDFGRLVSGAVYPGEDGWNMGGRAMSTWHTEDRIEHRVMLDREDGQTFLRVKHVA
jgi:hypothetical protein